jgi:phosphoglycerate kinase
MNLPTIDTISAKGKKVIVRADLDVDIENNEVVNTKRLDILVPTLKSLMEQGAEKILLIGHRGRPQKRDENLNTKPLVNFFKDKVTQDVGFLDYYPPEQLVLFAEEYNKIQAKLVVLENLRFWKEEEENSDLLATQLSPLGEVYVNEAFAASHREHASIVSLPKKIKEKGGQLCVGLRFFEEIENLSKVTINPKRPVVVLLSGIKQDKLSYIEGLKRLADQILIGGRLPEFIGDDFWDTKVFVSRLNPDKEDLTIHSIEEFEKAVTEAGTIVVSGPMGKFEDEGHRLGTERVFKAISKSKAFKLAGGGDTEYAIETLNLEQAFDWISIGGGAMLEYLSTGTLPAIEVMK